MNDPKSAKTSPMDEVSPEESRLIDNWFEWCKTPSREQNLTPLERKQKAELIRRLRNHRWDKARMRVLVTRRTLVDPEKAPMHVRKAAVDDYEDDCDNDRVDDYNDYDRVEADLLKRAKRGVGG